MPRKTDDTAEKPAISGGSWRRVARRALGWLVVLPLSLALLLVVLLYLPPVQDLVRGRAVRMLTERIGARVELEGLHLGFPLAVQLEGLHVADDRGDTLIHAGLIRTSADLGELLHGHIALGLVRLKDVRGELRQYADSTFNFQHIIKAFRSDKAPDTTSANNGGSAFSIAAIQLEDIRFDLDMAPSDLHLSTDLGQLHIDLDTFDLDPMRFHVNDLTVRLAEVHLRTAPAPPEPSTYPDLVNPLAGIDIRFRTIGLEAVAFTMATVGAPDSLWFDVQRAAIKARDVRTDEQRYELAQVSLIHPRFGMRTAPTPVATDSTGTPPWLDRQDGFRYWTRDMRIAVDQLRVVHGAAALHNGPIPPPGGPLEAGHLVYTDMALQAKGIVVNNARIAVDLDSLSVQGGPNDDRLELAAHLAATPDSFTLTGGRIEALHNHLTFRAAAAPRDLSAAYRNPEEVPFDAEVGGDVRLHDLMPLLHQLGMEPPVEAMTDERWATKLWIAGSLQDIRRAGIELDGDQGSTLHANGRITQATSWPASSYALTVEALTLGKGLHALMHAYAPPDVPLPARLVFKGDAQGTGYDASAHVDLKSDLGDLKGRAAARDWKGFVPGHLDVDLTADRIAAARLTGDTAIGPLSFTLVAQGERLHDITRQGTLTFTPTALTYLGNDLSSLHLKAEAAGDSLRTELGADAAATAFTLRTTGPWPQEGDSLVVAFDLALERLHLQELGLTPYTLDLDGRITGRTALLPEMHGRYALQAPGLRVFNTERTFAFERFTLSGLLDSDSTAVDLDCDAARVAYHANLSMDSTVALLRERLLGAFQEPYAFRAPPGRRIALKVDLPGTERLASLVHPALHAMEVKRFEGRYDSDRDSLTLNVNIPLVDYGGVEVTGLTIDLKAAGADLQGELAVLQVMRDSLHVDDLVLLATNEPGTLRTLFRLRDGGTDRYRIGLDLRREGSIPVLHLQEDLVLDRNAWQATHDNALSLGPEGPRARDLAITSGAQRIELRTEADGNHLELSGFELANLTGLVRTADSLALLRGTLDAHVLLPLREDERLKGELALHHLEVMDVALGTMEAELTEHHKDHYRGSVRLDAGADRAHATLEADLSKDEPRIAVESELVLNDLSLFKPLVQGYLFDLGGALNGDLRYEQEGEAITVVGSTAIREGRFGLRQTGAVYHIPADTVTFDRHGIALNDLEVRDARDNRFQLDGRVNTGAGHEPGLDLRLRTERFQLVNSTAKDNPMFYGKLFGGIDLRIGGTATVPTVKGAVSVLDSTTLSVVLPGSKVELIDHAGIVQFTTDFDAQDTLAVRSDSEMLRDSLAAQLPGIDLDLRIKLDRNARFAIVIDPTTGDAASFRGEADLRFRYNPEGDIYLQGPFTVVDGGYTVEFYGLVKKRFDLVPGGTIMWDGDPLAGRMDIRAKYSTKVAPYPLVANARGGLSESERNSLQAPLPFDVLINIREAVQAPNISFGLDMDRQVRNSYPQVNTVLDQLAKPGNQEELNRQVFGLLVLSTFIENEAGSTPGGSSLASTAARNSVNSILTQQLNRLTGQGIKGMDIQLGVSTYDQTQGGESYSRTTVDYKVTQRVLNDRVRIEAGGSLGYNEHKQEVSAMSNTKAPQYAIAYDLTADGRLRLRVYHENAYDLYDGELVNNGAAIMLTRDFEKREKELTRLRQDILERRNTERDQRNGP